MPHEKLLEEYTKLVEERLADYFEDLPKYGFISEMYDSLCNYVLRKGKRLASCSTILAYKGYTGRVDEQILKACIGIELYRHSILIHDDLIDRDEYRRGGKAFHKLFPHDERFGEGLAVFCGNATYALALQALQNSGFREAQTGRVIRLFIEEFRNVNESQVLDLLFEYSKPSVDEWYCMAEKRAASLFKATILAGAIFADAPKKDLKTLEEAAEQVGYAFDIQDDIIGTFATEEQYGRPTGGDIVLRKKPLHAVYAFQLLKGEELQRFNELMEKKGLSAREIEEIKRIIKECRGLEKAKETSRKHATRAKELIQRTGMSGESKRFFINFIDYISKSLDWYK